MCKEQYVSFENTKLLREKGFRGDCIAYYNDDGKRYLSLNAELFLYQCPTQEVACRWLREEKGIHIYPIPVTGFHYVVSIYDEKGNKTYNRILSRSGRHAYEDAVEAALQYVLNNLI